MPQLTPSSDSALAAECVLSALECARKGSTDVPAIRALSAALAAGISCGQGASEVNRDISAAISVKRILNEAGLSVVWPRQIQGEGDLSAFYTGVIYGIKGNGSSPVRELPKSVRVEERDKSGRDISREVAVAAVRTYNFLAGAERSSLGSGIADLQDRAQVIKCISQLIAANVTSERNLLHGAIFAAAAIGAHFHARGLLALGPTSRISALLAGVVFSAFGARGENLAPLSGFRAAEPAADPKAAFDLTAAACPPVPAETAAQAGVDTHDAAVDAKETLHHRQNSHALTADQCRLLAKVLAEAQNDGRDLDRDLSADAFKGCQRDALDRLGRDILEVLGENDGDVGELDLAGRAPRVQAIDVIQGVIHRLKLSASSNNLSTDYLELAARAAELAKEGIIENTSWELPNDFLEEFSPESIRELAEDSLCAENDELASMDDKKPLTAQHVSRITNLVDCLEAFAFRLRSIATSRKAQ